jgi:NAD(P)-dependent dehydrogenase (short-subunit alcohol dehydrogenase family)
VNVRAHFLVVAAALPQLAPRSSIVFVGSAASLRAGTGVPSYDASKAALIGLARQARSTTSSGRRSGAVQVTGNRR